MGASTFDKFLLIMQVVFVSPSIFVASATVSTDEVGALLQWIASRQDPQSHLTSWFAQHFPNETSSCTWSAISCNTANSVTTLKVTEKCDVYSFGVLVLEVMNGKYPSDLVRSLLSPAAIREGNLPEDVWDDRLEPPMGKTLEELVTVLMLAVACLHPNPQFRPTMYDVAQIITMQKSQTDLDKYKAQSIFDYLGSRI